MEMVAATPVPRRDGKKLTRCPRLQMDVKTVSAIEQSTGTRVLDTGADGSGGTVRVKIVLSKQQLKQVAAAVAGGGRGGIGFALPPSLEQLVSALKQKQPKKQAAAAAAEEAKVVSRRRARWSPALQSIPEECFS